MARPLRDLRRNSSLAEDQAISEERTRLFVRDNRCRSKGYVGGPNGLIGRIYLAITKYWQHVLAKLNDFEGTRLKEPMTTPRYRLFDGIHTSLHLWGDDLDVRGGNLDRDLQDSKSLREFTIEILFQVCETIEKDFHPAFVDLLPSSPLDASSISKLEIKLKDIKDVKEDPFFHTHTITEQDETYIVNSLSNPGDEEYPNISTGPSLDKALRTLKEQVEDLVDLTVSLENPFRDSDMPTVLEGQLATPQVHGDQEGLRFLDGIKHKCPRCDDRLAVAVSKLINDTTIRLGNRRQEADRRQLTGTPEISRPEKDASELFPRDSGYETATRDASHRVPDLPLRGSSSVRSGSVGSWYTRTLDSFEDKDGTIATPFPSQGKDLSLGDQFFCTACGDQRVKIESREWRRHIVSDLQPWICCQVLCDCNFSSFTKESDWRRHLKDIHKEHPEWDSTRCPFCLQIVTGENNNIFHHVERHLIQLSLAAITPDHGDGGDDEDSEMDSDEENQGDEEKDNSVSPVMPPRATPPTRRSTLQLQSHPAYRDATPEADGLWHCPWEGEADCKHQASKNKADHDKFIEEHLDSLWCEVEGCESNNGQPFATQEILYLHELEQHKMHEGGGRFLCTSPGCGRSRPGNGFMKEWVQIAHIKVVHNNLPDIGLPKAS